MTNAYEWVRKNKGVNLGDSYPYEEKDGKACRFKKAAAQGSITKFTEIDEGDEEALRKAVQEGRR